MEGGTHLHCSAVDLRVDTVVDRYASPGPEAPRPAGRAAGPSHGGDRVSPSRQGFGAAGGPSASPALTALASSRGRVR